MASPLDFSLADLTPEQLRAQQDFQRKLQLGGARAASVAPSAAGETVAEATARRAAGIARPGPALTSPPRIPASVAAPVAAPAGPTSLGQKAVGLLKGGRGVLGKLGAYGAAAGAAVNQFDTDATSRYATRFGVDEPANDGSIGSIAKDAALRLGGFGTDLANAVTLGGAGRLYRDKPTGLPFSEAPLEQLARPQTRAQYDAAKPAAAPAAGAPTPSIVDPGQQPINVERQPNGIPSFTAGAAAPGAVQYTGGAAGALKGGSFNTIPAANFVQPSSAGSAELSAARRAAADRGDFEAVAASYGGDFGGAGGKQSPADKLRSKLDNLPPIRTQGDVARYQAISGALAAIGGQEATTQLGAQKAASALAQAEFDNAMGAAELGIKKQTADAATTTAASRGQSKPQIIQGLPGEAPLIVDTATGRAKRATMVPDFAEFDAKMREDKRNATLTPAEMQAIYSQQFGQ